MRAKPLVAFCWSHRRGYLPILEEQLMVRGFEFVSQKLQGEFTWRKFALWERDFAEQNPDRLVIFLGAWDTICMGDESEVYDLNLEGHVTLASDWHCWPNPELEVEYKKKQGDVRSPCRFVNTGPIAGLGRDIVEAFDWGWRRKPIADDHLIYKGDNDQRLWTDIYLNSPLDVRLDFECRLGQTMQGRTIGVIYMRKDPGKRTRIINDLTGSVPVFVHANGNNSFDHLALEW